MMEKQLTPSTPLTERQAVHKKNVTDPTMAKKDNCEDFFEAMGGIATWAEEVVMKLEQRKKHGESA